MTPQFDLDALRKAAESLKPAPQKRYAPRNSQPYSATTVPGASVFASTPDNSSSSNNSSSYSEPSARVPPHLNSSNIRFQPPLTPLVVPPSLEPSELSPSSLPAALTPTTPQSNQSSLEIEFSLSTPDLPTYSPSTRAPRLTSKYEKIHQILSDLRTQQISPIDLIIQVLNPSDASYERYRANLYAERSSKITQLLDTIMADDAGKEKLLQFLQPRLEGLACDFVAEEMEQRQKASTLKGIDVVDPDFIENWSIDEDVDTTPFLTAILLAASQTDRARKENKLKKADQMCRVVTRQLLYQRSNRCLAFQAEFGLFLWSTGCARQTIDALFRCGISVSYDSVLHCIQALATHCIRQSIQVATEPHVFCYDNINLSTSIFVEQRGAAGPAKVTSGTFGVLYKLRNARAEHMLIAPIMARFKSSPGLNFNHDIKPCRDHLHSFHDQLLITIIQRVCAIAPVLEKLAKHPNVQYTARRAIPVGYKTSAFPVRATTIEEATVRGNILFHDDVYLNQLGRTADSLSKYAIPSFNDQLTNARVRAAQILRAKDLNSWTRREVFQLGFGLFHLCLNLVWAILHVHRGKISEIGSLSYFFALMQKVRLGNDQPDYHTLVAALSQVLDGLLLNAWISECGFSTIQMFAESKPTPEKLREIAAQILSDYATPIPSPHPQTKSKLPRAQSPNSSETDSTASDETEEPEETDPAAPDAPLPADDVVHQNTRVLTRDLLILSALIQAISDGDIGRVEVMLPHLAMMFRGSGCNKYCTEILHFLHNLKHVWTSEFADIMRDNMIVCISGRGPGHCMAIDLNIEHLINYLKTLLRAKGLDSTWDRLGDISAAIEPLRHVKKKVTETLGAAYQSVSHTDPDTTQLVWRVQKKVAEERLQVFNQARSTPTPPKLTKDILARGEGLLRSSTFKTFNKKIAAMIAGHAFEEEVDEVPAVDYSTLSALEDS